MSARINKIFMDDRKKLITFVTGGDPNLETSKKIIHVVAKNGADLIEIGMPFSDPMADGPTIQLSSNRAINNNINLDSIFSICYDFRQTNQHTPIILMGYYNVVFRYGILKFINACKKNGVDGLIIVDLQPEEDPELYKALELNDIDLIRLITPTTNSERLKTILDRSSGFLYYVTITGITGQHSAKINELNSSIKEIRTQTSLPVVAGFGIKNAKQVEEICQITDGAVVGSSIIKIIEDNLEDHNNLLNLIGNFVSDLKKGIN